MSSFCNLIENGDRQRCEVCGADFPAGGKTRAVCGVKRGVKKSIGGPGTELKKLLKVFGINATPNCACNAKAVTMDYHGAEWCAENIETIAEWLKEEATKRGLPFMTMPAKLLVRRAIANARKEAQRVKGTS